MDRMSAALVAVLLAGAGPAAATNGYFAHGYSPAQKALGGAGTAMADGALVVSQNPAGLAAVGERLDLGLGFFRPQRSYLAGERGDDADAGIITIEPGAARSRRERFLIPAIGWARPIDADWTFGVALYGNGGMNTDYRGRSASFADGLPGFTVRCAGSLGGGAPLPGESDNAGFCGNGRSTTSVDLVQLFLVPTLAWQASEHLSLGASPILAAQRFRALGLGAFARFSNRPERVSDNGYDYSFGGGYRLGLRGLWGPLAVGASWQSRIAMDRFEKYAGLFAGEGGFDIPESWNLGLALRLGERHVLLVDRQWIGYSSVRSVGNPMDPNRFVNDCALPRLRGDTAESPACLGAATGPGFGWRDLLVTKLGYEYAGDRFALRLGWSRNRQPIPASEVLFNVLAPGVPQVHYTAGLGVRISAALSLDLSLTHARRHPVTGANPLSNATLSGAELASALLLPGSVDSRQAFGADPEDQRITLDMKQLELVAGLSWRF